MKIGEGVLSTDRPVTLSDLQTHARVVADGKAARYAMIKCPHCQAENHLVVVDFEKGAIVLLCSNTACRRGQMPFKLAE
jgi:hypothetical protein